MKIDGFIFERMITRGKLHKLGRNVLKKNNVLEIEFNNYGILASKKIYTKNDMKKVKLSTEKQKILSVKKLFLMVFCPA